MLKVRLGQVKDIPSCLLAAASEGDKTFSRKDFLKIIKNPFAIFLVAELDKKVIGNILGFMVPTLSTESMIHQTMVHKKFRRKGIGSVLVENFIKEARRKGAKEVYAEVEKGYPYKFYKSCGFKKENIFYSMVNKK